MTAKKRAERQPREIPDPPHPSEVGVGLPAKEMARNDVTYGLRDGYVPVYRPKKELIPIRKY